MSKQLPPAGTHTGILNGQIVIGKASTGSLCAYIPVKLVEAPVAWSGKFTATIFNKVGEPMTRSIQNLKEVFGWDGIDPFWLTEQEFTDLTFDLVCTIEEYVPENSETGEPVQAFKVQYLNPLGGSSRMPEMADKKSILAEYGAKLRALAGAGPAKAEKKAEAKPAEEKPAEAASEKKAGPPSSKKAPPPATRSTPGGVAPTATMEEAWEAFKAANPGQDDAVLGDKWWSAVDAMFPGKNNEDLTIQQWGQLKASFAK